MRSCGGCRLCCKVFPVPALDKPAGAWCRHACAAGCAIHGPATPEICRRYDCYWREYDALPEAWRPDRIGVVVTEAGNVTVGYRILPVVRLHEDFAGASRSDGALGLLDYFIARGFAAMVICGMQARIEFDRAFWPGISSDDIEAALRYELAQDVEELKRLGAVGDDYRPGP